MHVFDSIYMFIYHICNDEIIARNIDPTLEGFAGFLIGISLEVGIVRFDCHLHIPAASSLTFRTLMLTCLDVFRLAYPSCRQPESGLLALVCPNLLGPA